MPPVTIPRQTAPPARPRPKGLFLQEAHPAPQPSLTQGSSSPQKTRAIKSWCRNQGWTGLQGQGVGREHSWDSSSKPGALSLSPLLDTSMASGTTPNSKEVERAQIRINRGTISSWTKLFYNHRSGDSDTNPESSMLSGRSQARRAALDGSTCRRPLEQADADGWWPGPGGWRGAALEPALEMAVPFTVDLLPPRGSL